MSDEAGQVGSDRVSGNGPRTRADEEARLAEVWQLLKAADLAMKDEGVPHDVRARVTNRLIERYLREQEHSEEQNRFLRKRPEAQGAWNVRHEHVFSEAAGKCMWPGCGARREMETPA
jgi:hypothetical protein